MKNILIILSLILMSVSSANAANGYTLKHANPMPNLMRVAMGNADILEINKDQMKQLRAWGKSNRPKMVEMVKKVMKQEEDLLNNALTTDSDTSKEADAMLETRKQIILMKNACRAKLKTILTEKQYAGVVSIYKSTK